MSKLSTDALEDLFVLIESKGLYANIARAELAALKERIEKLEMKLEKSNPICSMCKENYCKISGDDTCELLRRTKQPERIDVPQRIAERAHANDERERELFETVEKIYSNIVTCVTIQVIPGEEPQEIDYPATAKRVYKVAESLYAERDRRRGNK